MSAAAPIAQRLRRWLGAAVILTLVLLLELATRTGAVNAVLVPPPSTVAQRLWSIALAGTVVEPLARTLYLLAIAYAIGCVLAIALGVLMGRSRAVHGLFEPLVEVLRPLPKPALLPPLMLFLGLGTAMKVTAVALGVFFPVLINTIQGVRGADRIMVDTARTFQHSPAAVLWKVVLPYAMPLILSGMRIALGIALVLVVIAEMMAGTGGIGYLIIDLQRSFRVVDMYAWVVILALLGYALNEVFVQIEKRAIHWSGRRTD